MAYEVRAFVGDNEITESQKRIDRRKYRKLEKAIHSAILEYKKPSHRISNEDKESFFVFVAEENKEGTGRIHFVIGRVSQEFFETIDSEGWEAGEEYNR